MQPLLLLLYLIFSALIIGLTTWGKAHVAWFIVGYVLWWIGTCLLDAIYGPPDMMET